MSAKRPTLQSRRERIARVNAKRPRVTVVRTEATAERRARLVHLLAVLLDKPDAPDNRGRS